MGVVVRMYIDFLIILLIPTPFIIKKNVFNPWRACAQPGL